MIPDRSRTATFQASSRQAAGASRRIREALATAPSRCASRPIRPPRCAGNMEIRQPPKIRPRTWIHAFEMRRKR